MLNLSYPSTNNHYNNMIYKVEINDKFNLFFYFDKSFLVKLSFDIIYIVVLIISQTKNIFFFLPPNYVTSVEYTRIPDLIF